ncbi:7-deoxyloganetic acid glucosyltransferase [Vigna radiata var. radiata]|uniref:7-deoxyloganetic acid glucosyltransferase n=1 Tax=Vigna radiata var. radiata TaxID=3916 RepID=A0A1S3W0G3_VIGRR|nr:7-deoxyloganetic acid glucosyltransferase [Vigna radiata var. radiata]
MCVIGSNASIDTGSSHCPSSLQPPNMEQRSLHVVALPFPAEGHIKPMFNLAKLLRHKGHKITFVNTQHTHNRLLQSTDLPSFDTGFRFTFVADGLPHDVPPNDFSVILSSTSRSKVAEEFREMLRSFVENPSQWGPPSCVVVDGMMSTIAMDAAEELGVPVIVFRTYSATATWVTIHVSKVIQEGVMKMEDPEDVQKVLSSIPGLENLLRDCDLPYIFKLKPGHFGFDWYTKETLTMTRASALILNTFDHLEAPIITKLTTVFPRVYSIGPLHTLLKTQVTKNPSLSLSVAKEDKSCITWLDNQREKSVIYVSFGSVVKLSGEQFLEFWHGLVNSLKPFLWVVRKDLMNEEGGFLHENVPKELELGTQERGLLVQWAPQEKVLGHPAVGGFLTHCGWNSTVECIAAGVPMLCFPSMVDQTINRRSVSEQWGIGVDVDGTCDRFIIEKMVKDVLENRIQGLRNSVDEIAKQARDSIKETGSSTRNIDSMINDILSMKEKNIEHEK